MCLYRECIGMPVYVYKHMLGCDCAHSLVYVGLSRYVCEYMCACVCTFMWMDVYACVCYMCAYVFITKKQMSFWLTNGTGLRSCGWRGRESR